MPLYLDWRGRVYVGNISLNYQANDFTASLIEFFDGFVLNESGFYWLRVHGANCFGKDKLNFDNRVKFIDSVHDKIMALDRSLILSADSPIKFAAFCLAYSSYINNPSIKIHLPVFLDATCSGLQHIAALLGDSVLGELVNLKGNSRRDLYSETVPYIQEALSNHPNTTIHNVSITRDLIKKPIMTIPYSITPVGITNQLHDFFKDSRFINTDGTYNYRVPTITGNQVDLTRKDLFDLSQVVYNTVFSRYTSIKSIFTFFMDWVKLANKLNMRLSWITPSGTIISPYY